MTDIVKRLREPPFGTETSERNLMIAAADEITCLRAKVEKLRAALWDVHALANNGPLVWPKRIKATARAALGEK